MTSSEVGNSSGAAWEDVNSTKVVLERPGQVSVTLQDAWDALAVAGNLGMQIDAVPGTVVWLVTHHSGARPRPHVTVVGVCGTKESGLRALRNWLAIQWTQNLNTRMSALTQVNVNSDDDEQVIATYFRLHNSERYEIAEIVIPGAVPPAYQWKDGT
jgi:hypothetical protein